MKGNTAVAKVLKKEGINFITGFPANALFEEAAKEGIRFIKTRAERVAVNMTDGIGRVSLGKQIGVSVIMANQGLQNAYAGIAQAHDDSTPLLVLPGGPARRQMNHLQKYSAVQNLRPITKWVGSVSFADQVPVMMRRAFSYLRMGRPGPVVLEIPRDVGTEEFDDALMQYTPPKGAKPAGDPADVRAVAKALIAAKNPVIRAGLGILFANASDELRELAELLQIPVFTTLCGKSGFPENHPLSLGTGSSTRPKPVTHFLNKADLVFAIGSSITKEMFTTPIPDGKAIIQSTIDEYDINKDYPVEQAIIGDAKLVLRQLVDEIKKQTGSGSNKGNDAVAKEIKVVKDEWLKEWMPKLTSDEVPINPYRVVWDLNKALDPKKTIMTHDAGNPRDQMAPFYESTVPGGYIGWGKSTTLGSSLGFAMGAKLAEPDKTAVFFTGDGAFGMVGMDFETAAREKIPVLGVMINNSRLGNYSRHNPVASERYNLDVLSGDYAKVCEGLGGYTEKVVQPKDIIPAIERAKKVLATGQPALLEIITREEGDFSR